MYLFSVLIGLLNFLVRLSNNLGVDDDDYDDDDDDDDYDDDDDDDNNNRVVCKDKKASDKWHAVQIGVQYVERCWTKTELGW